MCQEEEGELHPERMCNSDMTGPGFRTIPLALVEGEIAAGTQTGEEWGWRTQQWGRSLGGSLAEG